MRHKSFKTRPRPGCRAFSSRSIELIAIAIYQTAVQLFSLDTGVYKNGGLASWTQYKEEQFFGALLPRRFPSSPPTDLVPSRNWYYDYDQNPEGTASSYLSSNQPWSRNILSLKKIAQTKE